MEFLSKSLEETKKMAFDFATSICREDDHLGKREGATVIGLYGELGAGKTTFMKYLAESFGIKETIQSPTFVIMKIYKTGGEVFKHLVHIDAYRIEKEEEMLNLGWREIVADPKNIVCVEWPERIAGILPPHIMLRFEHEETGENQRKISIA